MILQTEENYSKLLKENENLTKEASNKVLKENNKLIINTQEGRASSTNGVNQITITNNQYTNVFNNPITLTKKNSNSSIVISEESQKINNEYLKNIILKYLDATAVGNEFQIKVLENVIFSLLKISQVEKSKLEEKRLRSSFYYNLWYNARDFVTARIYGQPNNETEAELTTQKPNEITEPIEDNKNKAITEREI